MDELWRQENVHEKKANGLDMFLYWSWDDYSVYDA